MPSRFWYGTGVAASFAVVGIALLLGQSWWPVALGSAVIATALFACACPHSSPSLLPPVAGAGPDRDHARWYCHRCGASWTADLAVTARPMPRYAGYDEAKAVQAAARADVLDKRRRRLAVERAGLRPPAARSPRRPRGPRPLEPAVGQVVARMDRPGTGPRSADPSGRWRFGS